MNQSVDVIILPSSHSNGLAHIKSSCKPFLPESLVNPLFLESENTYCYTAYLPMTYGKEVPIRSQHLNKVAFFKLVAFCMMDGTTEYPGMEASQAFLLTFAKNNIFQFIVHSP